MQVLSKVDSRHPLTEMSSQRQPRRRTAQTYGKKKGGPLNTQKLYQQLFGQDENGIEATLAGLSLEIPAAPMPPRSPNPKREVQVRNKGTTSSNVKKESLISQEDSIALAPLLALSESSVEMFSVFGDKVTKSCQVEKIGEGSFAEVFKLTQLSSKGSKKTTQESPSSPKISSIIKVIPLEHPSSPASVVDRVSTIPSVAREINLLKHLDVLHGFTGFASLRIVKGPWPSSFLEAFRTFRKQCRKRAINVAPDEDFDANQIYALVEMDDAGTEVALIKRPSVFKVYDIFWTTVILLVNAEERIEFEHRDLHLSNICIKPKSRSKHNSNLKASPTSPELDIDSYILSNMTETPQLKLGLSNLAMTIIDYTVARAKLPPSTTTHPSGLSAPTTNPPHPQEENIVYDPMTFVSLPTPFSQTSDAESTLQFNTYKKCRAAAQFNLQSHLLSQSQPQSQHSSASNTANPQPKVDKYSLPTPLTNTIWLGYLLRCLIRRGRGRTGKLNVLLPLKSTTTKSKPNSSSSTKLLKSIQEEMWTTLLVVDSIINNGDDPLFPSSPIHRDEVQKSQEDGEEENESEAESEREWTQSELNSLPGSAKILLERAVEERWLGLEEIEEFKRGIEGEGEGD